MPFFSCAAAVILHMDARENVFTAAKAFSLQGKRALKLHVLLLVCVR